MHARLLDRINAALERHIPEQHLYLRSERGTRFIRLRPLSVIGVVGGLVVMGVWSSLVTAAFLMQTVGEGTAREHAERAQALYESRLSELAAERDGRAREAERANARFNAALDTISAMQTELLASEERLREKEKALEIVQASLRRTRAERDEARARAAALSARLAEKAGGEAPLSARLEDAEASLGRLARITTRTAAERDRALAESREAHQRVAALQRELRLRSERELRVFSRLEDALAVSLTPLDGAFRKVGLDPEAVLKTVRQAYSGQGGPLTPIAVSTRGEPTGELTRRANALLGRIDEINLYRIAAEKIPLDIPVKARFRLTSGFGMRKDPKGGGRRMHKGVDLAAPTGTAIYAPADGTVIFAGRQRGYGKVIEIRHAMGFETRYAHLSRIRVRKGQRVSRGDRIGDMGSTGRSTGPHLHYELRRYGKAVNPMTFIKAGRDVY